MGELEIDLYTRVYSFFRDEQKCSDYHQCIKRLNQMFCILFIFNTNKLTLFTVRLKRENEDKHVVKFK